MSLRPEVERELRHEAAVRALVDYRRTVKGPQPVSDVLGALLEGARRRLPPEAWCRMAEEEAQRLGMEIEWAGYEGEGEGDRRCWAEVTTPRGEIIVAPQPFQTWQQAFAAIGIEPGEAPE